MSGACQTESLTPTKVEITTGDLSIFHKAQNECDPSDYTKCDAMERIFASSQYCSMLKKKKNADSDEIFIRFMEEVYNGKHQGIIDDYIHLKQHHEHELERINEDLIKSNRLGDCDIMKCAFTTRHMHAESVSVSDEKLAFYGEIFDGLHFHLLHCFEAGLRVKRSDDEDEIEEDEKQSNDEYYDAAFARLNGRIMARHANTARFERFSTKSAKFNIVNDKKEKHDTNKNHTYLDVVVKHLVKLKMHEAHIRQFVLFLKQQRYDTDAMEQDHAMEPENNISSHTIEPTLLKHYDEFMKETKLESASFSIGFRFYYWPAYKGIKELTNQHEQNICDHSGYHIDELFIEPKYATFKEEISHYKYVSLKQYGKIIVKVKQYIQADVLKQTIATHYGTKHCSYDIKTHDPIHFDHLLALVLYTDYTELSSAFSSTFRKCDPFETITSVKQRNCVYYWMSRRLRECVEIFGQCRGYKRSDKRYNKDKGTELLGPFYCGMSAVMSMPSFSMRLCSPTSTSKQIEVAMKFSGARGIVLQMDTPKRVPQHIYLHAFNASWISRFKEEDERLFFGGAWPIKIQSIRIRATTQNFGRFIRCLHYLDTMVTGGDMYGMEVSEDDLFIIKCLINGTVNGHGTEKRFDDYIYSTFDAFRSAKKQVVLSLYDLDNANTNVRDLLMNALDRRDVRKEEETNLCKAKIFEIFKNVKSVVIVTTFVTKSFQYSFSISMDGLLSLIKSASLDKVTLKAVAYKDNKTWIENVWCNASETLTKQYDDANYDIAFETGLDAYGDKEFQFIITAKY